MRDPAEAGSSLNRAVACGSVTAAANNACAPTVTAVVLVGDNRNGVIELVNHDRRAATATTYRFNYYIPKPSVLTGQQVNRRCATEVLISLAEAADADLCGLI